MTKSQNTKNEQQKDLCITSEQLTEQWKKGELINGKKYYITFFDSEPFEATFRAYHEAMFPYWKFEANGKQYCDENGYDCVKVLAPVPSFDEWEQLQNWADFTNDYHELREKLEIAEYENAQLKEYERIVTSYNMKPIDYDIACETVNKLLDDNKRLKHDVGNLGYKIKNQRHEIDNRLKEIEKLKELLKECKTPLKVYNEMFGNKEELLTKIDEALK